MYAADVGAIPTAAVYLFTCYAPSLLTSGCVSVHHTIKAIRLKVPIFF